MQKLTQRFIRFGLFLSFCLIASTGCRWARIPPPDNALESPDQIREAIQARTDELRSARFKRVTLDYFGRDERVKLRQLILVERPAKLRVQTRIPGTEEIMSLLTVDGNNFSLHERKSNKYYTGAPTPHNISRLLPVNLSAPDVVGVLLGSAPWEKIESFDRKTRLEWNGRRGEYQLTFWDRRGHRLKVFVRHDPFLVTKVAERDDEGELLYRYTTEDWRRFDGRLFPEFRRFVWPERDADFSLTTGQIEVNPKLPTTLFSFPAPPGSETIRLKKTGPAQTQP